LTKPNFKSIKADARYVFNQLSSRRCTSTYQQIIEHIEITVSLKWLNSLCAGLSGKNCYGEHLVPGEI